MKNSDKNFPYRGRKHFFVITSRDCDILVNFVSKRTITKEQAYELFFLALEDVAKCKEGQANE